MNPFTFGNPISDPMRFMNRKDEADLIFTRLHNSEFESSSIVGERRIGKTSLLNYLAHASIQSAHGLDPDKYLFVYMNLQMVDETTTPTRLWQRLLQKIDQASQDMHIKQMIEKIYETEPIETFMLADLFDSIDENHLRIVLLLDEFEHITKNANFGPGFFDSLRSLTIRRRRNLALVTSSRQELIELCHSEVIRSSPFFNIFAYVRLRLFTKADALHLITLALNGTDIRFTEEELTAIFCLAGYHPYFLQVVCYFLFEAYSSQKAPGEHIPFMSKYFLEEVRSHFKYYWHNSSDEEKILLTTLAVIEQQRRVAGLTFNLSHLRDLYIHSTQLLTILENRGLVVRRNDTYFLFSFSFGDWIYNELTDIIHDQQSYSEWLTANRSMVERLSRSARKDIQEILPKISSKYRELIILWASDPRNLAALVGLLRAAVVFHK